MILLEKISRRDGWEESVHFLTRHITESDNVSYGAMHYHEYIELLFGTDGVATVLIGNSAYEMREGDLVVINAGDPHEVICKEGKANYYVIKFLPIILYGNEQIRSSARFLLPLWQKEFSVSPVIKNKLLCGSGIDGLFHEIAKEWRERKMGFEIAVQSAVMKIFVWVLRASSPTAPTVTKLPIDLMRQLEKALILCEEDISGISLSKAARQIGLSYSYLSRSFKDAYGISFSSYLELRRLREAEKLLMTEDTEITEIAGRLGFCSTSYFIERFRKKYGESPGSYRKRIHINKKQDKE